MKTIQLSLTDSAFGNLKNEVFVSALSQNGSGAAAAWMLVLDAMERGDTEKTIRTRAEANPEPELP
jgi:hypothetical protein